jgi:transcriptional regulator with XRE-family HTH domain
MGLQPDRIKQRRHALHLSQEQLAELVGVNQPQISRWELGINDIGGDTLTTLSRALGTSADWLLGLSDIPFPIAPSDTALDSMELDLITTTRTIPASRRHLLLILARELAALD